MANAQRGDSAAPPDGAHPSDGAAHGDGAKPGDEAPHGDGAKAGNGGKPAVMPLHGVHGRTSAMAPPGHKSHGPDEVETTRLEAFSDGVFAIAITLLVLELKVPDGDLWQGLLHEWPALLSFTLSFVTILIMWTNHHANLRHVVRVDARLLFANGLLLLFITFIPFPTAVLSNHLARTDAKVAAAFYAGTFVCINLAWAFFWAAIGTRRATLAPRLGSREVRIVNVALVIGFVSYLVATLLAFWSAAASVVMVMAIAGFWTVQALRADSHDHAEVNA